MSRSGYCEDYDGAELHLYRGAVASAMRGKRGQKFFRDLIAALDALSDKRLIANNLEDETGQVCALGALGKARGLEMRGVNPEDADKVGALFDIAECLARETVFENDEHDGPRETVRCGECRGTGKVVAYGSEQNCWRCSGTGESWRYRAETPEERFVRVRAWAVANLRPNLTGAGHDQ